MVDETEKSLNDAVQAFSRQIADQVSETEKRAAKAEKRIKALEGRLEREKEQRRKKVHSTQKSALSLERKSAALEKEIRELNQALAQHQEEKQRLQMRSEALTEQVKRLSDDHHASTELFEHAQRELDRRQRSVREVTQKHEETRAELMERIAATEKALAQRTRELENSRALSTRTVEQLKATQESQSQLQKQVHSLQAAATEQEEQVTTLKSELAAAVRNETELRNTAKQETAAAKLDSSRLTRMREELRAERLARETAEKARQQTRTRLENEIASLQKQHRSLVQALDRLQQELEETGRERERADKSSAALMWRVRDASGTEYGPATLSELQTWAAECRIGPAHQVSLDGDRWTAVADLTAVAMDWVVDLPDGSTFGPFHLQATVHLVESNVIAPDQVIRNLRTQATHPVKNVLGDR